MNEAGNEVRSVTEVLPKSEFLRVKAEMSVSYEMVAKQFLYNAATGDLIRLTGHRTTRGTPVAYKDNGGYLRVLIKGRLFFSHRVAWLLAYREWPASRIDHIDGNQANNALCNLRLATAQLNMINSKLNKNNKTGFKGVFKEPNGRFSARLQSNRKTEHLGMFSTKELAAEAYAAAASRLFGEFVRPF